jgi:hypothetical protein
VNLKPYDLNRPDHRGHALQTRVQEIIRSTGVSYDEAFLWASNDLEMRPVIAAMKKPPEPASLTTANSLVSQHVLSRFARNAIKTCGTAGMREDAARLGDPALAEFVAQTISASADNSNDARTAGKSFVAVAKKAQHELGLDWDAAWEHARSERPDLFAQMAG